MKTFNKKESGFTLIELLVVIAIIGLLSSIVLVSLEGARNEAKNSAKNQLVLQYTKALELYRSDNTSYPIVSEGIFYCLGESDGSNACQVNISGNSSLILDLDEYISGVPNDKTPIPTDSSGLNFDGISYTCPSGSNCSEYQIKWYLLGPTEKCIDDSFTIQNYGGNTVCTYSN